MGSDVARNLIARIGGVGCLLDLSLVVEICEQIGERLDFSRSDLSHGIVGALEFRQTRIPAVDPTLRLELSSQIDEKEKTALVMKSSEGNWAMLVDRVEEICPSDRLVPCIMPPLLKFATREYYSKLELFQNEPMVVLDPEQFYGSSAAVA